VVRRQRLSRRLGELLDPILGPSPRAFVGLLLLAGCGLWIHQNQLLPQRVLENPTRLGEIDASATQPLHLLAVLDPWLVPFNSLNPGIAGLVLLLSLSWRSWRMNLFLIPAALVIFLGESWGVPAATLPLLGEQPAHRVSLVVGLVLLALGFVFDHFAAPRAEDRDDF
jgi:hypothetical protein